MTTSEELLWVVVVKSVFAGVCMVLAIIGNVSAIYAVIRNKKMQTVPNFFVCGLAVGDLMYAIIGQSTLIATTIPRRWILGDFLCKFVVVANTTALTASIWTLTAIGINRYIAIRRPFQLNSIFTKKKTLRITVIIWICALLISLPPVIGFGSINSGYNFCLPDARSNKIYPAILIITNYFIPLFTLTACYVSIHRGLKAQKISKKELGISPPQSGSDHCMNIAGGYSPRMLAKYIEKKIKKDSSDDVTLNSFNKVKSTRISAASTEFLVLENPSSPNSFLEVPSFKYSRPNSGTLTPNTMVAVEKNRLISKERRLTLMLSAVVIAFFLCYTPFVVGTLLFGFKLAPTNFGLVTFGIVIFGINGVINPVIYGVMNKNFRQAYKEMYKCCFRESPIVTNPR